MGGNALKNVNAVRLPKRKFEKVSKELLSFFKEIGVRAEVPKSYRLKEDFGDLDVVVENGGNMKEIVEKVRERFDPKEVFRNGTVYSFSYDLGNGEFFQVDLIFVPVRNYESSVFYLSYNDLSNLLGRIARRLGLKFGHDGLSLLLKDDGGQKIGEIPITKNPKEIYDVLGVSYERYERGFDALEEIFDFVASSDYFDPDIFALKSLDHANRTRNRKRKTYMEFLRYLDRVSPPPGKKFGVGKERIAEEIFARYPEVREKREAILQKYGRKKRLKEKFNGNMVMSLTGLKGEPLGRFMANFKKTYGEDFILESNPEEIENAIRKEFAKTKTTDKDKP